MQPLKAYFLTWTCFGTWLHGDSRGSVDFRHNVYGTSRAEPHAWRNRVASARLVHPPVTLDSSARSIVHGAILRHCEVRGWRLLALNVRSNHVHVVVSCGDLAPEAVMGQFKAYATRDLRAAHAFPPDHRIWTEGGSTRYLWTDEQVSNAATYVTDHQGADLV